ncbi:sorbitol dehydrogenase family protein [Collimonas silvisoli]|uniref:sorbitol dehydrogenase family protein n=1 Tax=Collimonas silvisoli TaxID=2825884 RepID=UPI001B8BC230|nr:sorbitol dehydrogenase family protein [Collimonas silvisoli]
MKQRPPVVDERSNDQPIGAANGKRVFSASRRSLMLLAGVSFAVMSTPRWLQQASAQTITPASSPPSASNQQQTNFMALSALLTGAPKLNPRIGARLYGALGNQTIEFEKQAAALWQYSLDHNIKDVDNLAAAVGNDTALSLVLHTIVSAWYLGVVGDGGVTGGAKVIAFEQALMFDQVRDAVVVPTYCRAAPGYWVTQPAVLKARI